MQFVKTCCAVMLTTALLALGFPAVARGDSPSALTLVAERSGTTNSLREQGQGGASLSVARGTTSYGDVTVPTLTFNSTVGSKAGTLQSIDISADLAPGTYATSRLPGQADAVLDPGSISQCGGSETGTLTVLDAAYTDSGVPSVFAASFDVGACDANPAVHGEIRWNSSAALALVTAPATVAIDEPVQARTTADVDVVFTAQGNVPTTLGDAAVAEKPQWDGSTYWSLRSDGCAGATLQPGQSCAVTMRFTPGYPNGVPAGALTARVSVSDGQSAPVSVTVSAGIAPLPGQPRGLAIDGAFRHLVLRWGVPSSWPNGWTRLGSTQWNVYRVGADGSRQAVGSTLGTAAGPTWYMLPALPARYSGTFVVQGVQGGIAGADSAPISMQVADRELIYLKDGLRERQLAPADGAAYSVQVGAVPSATDAYDVTTSADQRVMAWEERDHGDPQSASIRVGTLDGTKGNFPDVSGGDTGAVHWDVDPAVSPDGARLVYTHSSASDDPATVLRLASLQGISSVHDLANSAGLSNAAFTPDGTAVIAVEQDAGSTSLVKLNLTSGTRSALPGTAGLSEPAVSSDGRIVAVRAAEAGSSELVVIAKAGAVPAVVPGVPSGLNWQPTWSRDGLVVFTHRDSLTPLRDPVFGNAMSADPATGKVVQLTSFASGGVSGAQILVEDRPDSTAPTATLSAIGQSPVTLGATATLAWTGSDPAVALHTTSGVGSFDVRYRSVTATRGWSGYTYPAAWQRTTARHASLSLAMGAEYCVSVRARDVAGNTSAWSAQRCVLRAADDRALLTSSARRTSTHYFNHTYTRTSTAHATLHRAGVTAGRVALVVTTCATCGSIDVYLAGHRLGRISTHSSATHFQQVRWLPAGVVRSGTLELRAVASTHVYIDGFVTTR